jgi:MFS family permease
MRGFAGRALPNVVVFLSGLAIMVLELVAARLVAKYIGSSLETWTTVIAVILAGMSLGNYWGGRLSDQRNPIATLPYLLAGAALLCLSVLVTNEFVGGLELISREPRFVGIVTTITLIFLPPACVLGTIQPMVARWAIEQSTRTGAAFGNLGAWNTLGNILGTFLTGFVLLSSFGVRSIIVTSSAILGATAVGCWLIARLWSVESSEPPRPLMGVAKPEKVAGESQAWVQLLPNAFVFVTGLSIMMVELVGSRLISRATGTSIYTWTSLIGIVLAGISAGNHIGGRLADRFNPSRTLPNLFLLASMFCALLLMADTLLEGPSVGTDIVNWLLKWLPASVRTSDRVAPWLMPAGIFASVFVVFFAPTLALGTISPVAAKLALERAQRAGAALGNVYAWGAIGSIVGSFLTGFLLISLLGTKALICVIAGLLALISVAMPTSGLGHAVWAGMLMATAISVTAPDRWQWAVRTGEFLKVREHTNEDETHADSNYYHLKVQPSREHEGAQELVLDNLIHGYVLPGRPRDLRYDYELIYASIMERAGAFPSPVDSSEPDLPPDAGKPLRTLFIGGGSYTYPRYIEACHPGSTIVVAEIDPAVTRMAHRALFLPETTTIKTRWGDARATIDRMIRENAEAEAAGQSRPNEFDFVFGDAFNDFSVPWHLTTLEFNAKIDKLLAPNGVYMINIIDNYRYAKFLGAYVRTAREAFTDVDVFCTARGGPGKTRETFVIAMSNKPIDYSNLGAEPGEREFEGSVLTESELAIVDERSGGARLTDDYAPVENFLAPVARER